MYKKGTCLLGLVAAVLITFGVTQWLMQSYLNNKHDAIMLQFMRDNRMSETENRAFGALRKQILLAGSYDDGFSIMIITVAVGAQFVAASIYVQRRRATEMALARK